MTTFFTGCTHFHHANIIKLANRPFADVYEMDQIMIERWNRKVTDNDIVYHLGDIGWFSSATDAAHMLGKLNGEIILVQGNHDPHVATQHYLEIEIHNTKLVLFHYPIEDWNGRWQGSIHLHCHTHSPTFRNPSIPYVGSSSLRMEIDGQNTLPSRYPPELKCNRFNVGVDATGFAPVSFAEIVEESTR